MTDGEVLVFAGIAGLALAVLVEWLIQRWRDR